MEKLREFLNSIPPDDQVSFAQSCGTTIGYLRNAISLKKTFGSSLCIAIDENSNGLVRCEDLDPSANWAYLRGTAKVNP